MLHIYVVSLWFSDSALTMGRVPTRCIFLLEDFTAYNALPSEGAKLRFAAGKDQNQVPSRKTWNDCITKNYSKWGINGIVIQALNRANAHPVKQMLGGNTLDV